MKRMITKQSTVTPMSTLTKSKPVGQGVKNIGKGKGSKPMSMGMKTAKNAASEGAMEGAQNFTKVKLALAEKRANNKGMSMQMGTGAAAGAGMPRFAMKKTVSKVGSGPASPKPKAKMLPEVKVTAKKPMLQFGMKRTVKKIK
jgi:hypothetical protein